MGLSSTHQIARVLVNPKNSDDVCVCAIGHLWGYSGDRGMFRTQDGGKTWQKLTNGLPNDGKTGCIDLVRDPKNPKTLYAGFYQRLRQPWTFHSGGDQGGIYKSTNGGNSWKKMTVGLPEGPTGRIGLAIYEKNPKILMAIIEAERTDTLATPGSGIYRTMDGGKKWTYVNTYNNRPFYYSQIKINPHDDQRVYVLTTRFMVSPDGGKTLKNGSEDQEVHGDFHAMWLDPNNRDRYYLGADKGLSLTYDHGSHFTLIDNLPIAQYYRINYDMRDPYYVYGGLQDNGSYATSSFSRDARGILSDNNWKMHWGDGQDAAANPIDWTDMYTSMENGSFFKYNPKTRDISRISPSPLNTVNYWEHFDKDDPDQRSAKRFNWSAPLVMSPHNYNHIYVGGNHLYRSVDKGNSWKIISPDLSTNHPVKRIQGQSGGITPDNTGAETHCSITGISISPISEDVIWIGTDDGNVQVTMDGGKTWENVRDNIPEVPDSIWVSRVEASKFKNGRVYVTFDGHRSDHFGTWIFKSEDYGQTWSKITEGISEGEVVRVIREDVKNESLLFVGTETGIWFTLNQGRKWMRLKKNLPTVSVYDIKIHTRDNDLIVGTHGRSLWVLDDISPLQQASETTLNKSLHIFDQRNATLWKNISRGGQRGHFWFAGENPATIQNTSSIPRAEFSNLAAISFLIGQVNADSVVLTISDLSGQNKRKIRIPATPGIHRYYWNREFDAPPFTDQELEELDQILGSILEQYDNSRVRRAINAINGAEDSETKRRILGPLTQGYLNFKVDKKFMIPTAEEGSYKVKIEGGGSHSENILVIRNDPITAPGKY